MALSRATPKRSGRRPGPTESRNAIADAARTQFGELGYDRATFRGIAAAAGADPALVVHFFGTKDELFKAVMALPPIVAAAIEAAAEGPREGAGRRFAELVVRVLEEPVTRAIVVGRIRSAVSHPHAAELIRETGTRDVARLTAAVGADRPETRAVLIGSQLVGVAFARYVVQVEPLASMSPSDLVDVLAPVFQHYLVEPLRD
jgi:AcrR family transcriptional regulator